jgi:DNA-binding SARP family transcriptional activator
LTEQVVVEAKSGKLEVDFDGLKSDRYDTSSDFTNDIELLESVADLVAKFVDCPAFDDWMHETDSNYSGFKIKYFHDLVEAATKFQQATKAFNEHIYGLDE